MAGAVSWQAAPLPYSSLALWKALPVKKLTEGESLNVLDFSTPKDQLPTIVVLCAKFARFLPEA